MLGAQVLAASNLRERAQASRRIQLLGTFVSGHMLQSTNFSPVASAVSFGHWMIFKFSSFGKGCTLQLVRFSTTSYAFSLTFTLFNVNFIAPQVCGL